MNLILFDIDGTLVDSDDLDAQLYVEAVQSVVGVEIDDDWTTYRHVTDSGILEEILDREGYGDDRTDVRNAVERGFVELVATHLDEYRGSVKEIRGATAFIATLAKHPLVQIGLATGGWKESALLKLRAIGLDANDFPLASASDAVSRTAIMELAEQRTRAGVASTRRTYFGDGPWDKRASQELGFEFVAIGDSVDHAVRFPDYQDSQELLEALRLAH